MAGYIGGVDSQPDEEPDRDDAGEDQAEDRASQVLRTFLGEPMLWPVGLVLFLSTSSFGALVLVYAIRLRGIAAGMALLLLIFMTVYRLDPDIRARKLRPSSAVLLAFWAGSTIVAFVLNSLGAFR